MVIRLDSRRCVSLCATITCAIHTTTHPTPATIARSSPRHGVIHPHPLTLLSKQNQTTPNNKCHGSALHTPRWRGPPSDGVMSGAMFGARLGHPWGGDCAASCSLTLPVITGALAPPSHLAPSRSHYPSISATGASCWTRSSTQMPLTSSSGSAAASTLFQFLDIVSVSRHYFSFSTLFQFPTISRGVLSSIPPHSCHILDVMPISIGCWLVVGALQSDVDAKFGTAGMLSMTPLASRTARVARCR